MVVLRRCRRSSWRIVRGVRSPASCDVCDDGRWGFAGDELCTDRWSRIWRRKAMGVVSAWRWKAACRARALMPAA